MTRKEDEEIDFDFFESKIAAALARRESLFADPETTAFRVFNGEGDGIGGLTIDYFDGFYMVSWYSEGIYSLKHHVYSVMEKIIDYKGVYEKKRFDAKGEYIEQDDFVKGQQGDFPIIVKENGMNFAVNLNDGAMTGIFLDQRDVRQAIRDKYSEGKKCVEHVFLYGCIFCCGGTWRCDENDECRPGETQSCEDD